MKQGRWVLAVSLHPADVYLRLRYMCKALSQTQGEAALNTKIRSAVKARTVHWGNRHVLTFALFTALRKVKVWVWLFKLPREIFLAFIGWSLTWHCTVN